MRQRIFHRARKIWPVFRYMLLLIFSVVLISVLIVVFDHYHWTTGFNKTLWDWLDLLIVPAVIGLGALWANWTFQENEHRRAEREATVERMIASERN